MYRLLIIAAIFAAVTVAARADDDAAEATEDKTEARDETAVQDSETATDQSAELVTLSEMAQRLEAELRHWQTSYQQLRQERGPTTSAPPVEADFARVEQAILSGRAFIAARNTDAAQDELNRGLDSLRGARQLIGQWLASRPFPDQQTHPNVVTPLPPGGAGPQMGQPPVDVDEAIRQSGGEGRVYERRP